jgi:hypothetical protein
MMTSRGLSDSPLFTVPESPVDADGLLPPTAVGPIVGWLHDLAADPEARRMVMTQTLDGAIRHNVLRTHDVADAMDAQIELCELLYREIDTIYRSGLEAFAVQSTDGTLLRGEVLVRWQEFVGTGELSRSVEEKTSRIRDRLVDGVTGKRTRSSEVVAAIEHGLFTLIVEHAEAAAETSSRAWAKNSAGRALLGGTRDLDRAARDFRTKAEHTVRDWRQAVLELVRTDGADKRMTARFLAFGVNGIAVALMIVMFADSSDEVEVGGTVALGQKLLSAIFGDDVVRDLVAKAHVDLESRVAALFEGEMQRFVGVLGRPDLLKASQAELREAARLAEYARHADFLNIAANG